MSGGGRGVLGQDPREVVIGVSPAVGRDVWRCLSGLAVPEVLAELLAGLEEEGCTGRVVRFNDTVDLGAYESPYNVKVHYVSVTSTNPVTPFNGWSIAATPPCSTLWKTASGRSSSILTRRRWPLRDCPQGMS